MIEDPTIREIGAAPRTVLKALVRGNPRFLLLGCRRPAAPCNIWATL
jgi:hypothetical protein